MAEAFDTTDFQSRLQHLDKLLQQAERIDDAAARACTREVVRAVLDVHAVAFERVLTHLNAAGSAAVDAFVRDPVIGGLLVLHGLHPQDLETRVEQALEQVRPFLHSHGGNVELLGVQDGVVRLRLEGSCDGCPSSAQTMRQTIESAIVAVAPDAAQIDVEGIAEEAPLPIEDRSLFALPVV
jgi:Fe-S cluster biogenesis protein NfuA